MLLFLKKEDAIIQFEKLKSKQINDHTKSLNSHKIDLLLADIENDSYCFYFLNLYMYYNNGKKTFYNKIKILNNINSF